MATSFRRLSVVPNFQIHGSAMKLSIIVYNVKADVGLRLQWRTRLAILKLKYIDGYVVHRKQKIVWKYKPVYWYIGLKIQYCIWPCAFIRFSEISVYLLHLTCFFHPTHVRIFSKVYLKLYFNPSSLLVSDIS
jgi:hypothetical protein